MTYDHPHRERSQNLLTINASPEMRPTGIPPHDDQLKKISKYWSQLRY